MNHKAFTLLEIAVTTAVLGMLAVIALPSLAERMERLRLEEEEANLSNLETEMKRSFLEVDSRRNLSVFSDAQQATIFSARADISERLGGMEWYSKLARLHGLSPSPDFPLSAESQAGVYRIAANSFGNARWLSAGPQEAGQQRYLMLSLVAPEGLGLHIPANDGSREWFEEIWNHDFEGLAATLPPGWEARLTPSEAAAWASGRGNTTRVHCLLVRRIVQPKYRVIVNNTHPAYTAWIDYDGQKAKVTSLPATGPTTSEEIPAGKLIVVRRGITDPGTEAYRFYLNENTSVSIQQ